MHIGDEVDENRHLNEKMNDCSMTFQNISALRALGGDVKKKVHLQNWKIRSHGRKHFSIYKHFPRCAQLGAMLRYLERNFSGAIVMKRSIFEE